MLAKESYSRGYTSKLSPNKIYEEDSTRIMSTSDLEIYSNKVQEIYVQYVELLAGGDNIGGMKVSVTLLSGIDDMHKYSTMSK